MYRKLEPLTLTLALKGRGNIIFSLFCFLFPISCFLFPVSSSYGAFNNLEIGARPVAMGGAFVAIADDTNALVYNASGIGYVDDFQLGGTYSQQFGGLIDHNYVAAIVPLGKLGRIGLGFATLGEDSNVYTEQAFILSYARQIGLKISLGTSLKSLSTKFNGADVDENPYFEKSSASAFSADLGILAKPIKNLNLGFSVGDLIPADISISANEEDKVPINFRAGLAYNLSGVASAAEKEEIRDILRSTILIGEAGVRNKIGYFRAGVESWVHKTVALRAGYSLLSSVSSTSAVAFGASLKLPISSTAIQFDYAFQVALNDLKSPTSHRVSTNFSF